MTVATLHCQRDLCSKPLPSTPVSSVRNDSIVSGMDFCSAECRVKEARVRKQRERRRLRLDHQRRFERDIQRKYGMTLADWAAMFAQQKGKCAICQHEMSGKKTCVDHDHRTGAVRGLLCNDCNHGLGKFKDNVDNLLRAVEYLAAGSSKAAA